MSSNPSTSSTFESTTTATVSSRGPLTSHVLDTGTGRPATGVRVLLSRLNSDHTWSNLSQRLTDSDGRCDRFLNVGELTIGIYRLNFDTKSYFERQFLPTFYPYVEIVFEVKDTSRHHHVPLILSAHGYSTYRGS